MDEQGSEIESFQYLNSLGLSQLIDAQYNLLITVIISFMMVAPAGNVIKLFVHDLQIFILS
jgi:hypothetical protein